MPYSLVKYIIIFVDSPKLASLSNASFAVRKSKIYHIIREKTIVRLDK